MFVINDLDTEGPILHEDEEIYIDWDRHDMTDLQYFGTVYSTSEYIIADKYVDHIYTNSFLQYECDDPTQVGDGAVSVAMHSTDVNKQYQQTVWTGILYTYHYKAPNGIVLQEYGLVHDCSHSIMTAVTQHCLMNAHFSTTSEGVKTVRFILPEHIGLIEPTPVVQIPSHMYTMPSRLLAQLAIASIPFEPILIHRSVSMELHVPYVMHVLGNDCAVFFLHPSAVPSRDVDNYMCTHMQYVWTHGPDGSIISIMENDVIVFYEQEPVYLNVPYHIKMYETYLTFL